MANAALIYPFRAPPREEPLVRKVFPFLSLPAEIRTMIYEFIIFPDGALEFFIVNPMLDLSLLRVCKSVSQEALAVLYTKRIAVISFLPHQYYLHGRTQHLEQLLRITEVPSKESKSTVSHSSTKEPEKQLTGHICPGILVRFQRIRVCLFYNANFPKSPKRIKFNAPEELKRVLEVLRDFTPSTENTFPGGNSLELIIAINPRPQMDIAETLRRQDHVREQFLELGIPIILRDVREMRILKIGGNLTRDALVKLYVAAHRNRN